MISIFDIGALVLMGYGAYNGFKKGLIVSIVTTLSLFIAIWGAVQFQDIATSLLKPFVSIDISYLPYLAFVLVFIVFVVGVHFIGTFLKKIIHMTLLGSLDTLAGGLLGIIKIALFLGVIVFAIQHFAPEKADELMSSSMAFPILADLADFVAGFFPPIEFEIPDIPKSV
ncbi:CvpA family protein [Persicobacter sp. CCB-QB2]|uniref:CvpA family protein n=1 Tax=Persicobacter sp. CCB-QB2 TaxID=1561025 RepID=UPI0012F9EC2B|nr:CvpA family protein [Persicobacter sp. CCB-QB2]